MSDLEVFPGISIDPEVRFAEPCLVGTRIDVATIVGAVAAGESVETLAEEYVLSVEQIRAAIGYAAHSTAPSERAADERE